MMIWFASSTGSNCLIPVPKRLPIPAAMISNVVFIIFSLSKNNLSIAVHFLVVVLILTADDGLPPLTIIEIPLDGLLDAVLKFSLRQPTQLVVDLGRIDGITHIMTLTITNVSNQVLRLAQFLANNLHDFDPLTNSFECYRNYPTAGTEKTPVAQHLALRVLTLPLYADLALEDVDRICDIILG